MNLPPFTLKYNTFVGLISCHMELNIILSLCGRKDKKKHQQIVKEVFRMIP